MEKVHIPEHNRKVFPGPGCNHGDRVLSWLLLVIGCLCVVGFVALYQMQLARDTEMEWLRREMEYVRQHCTYPQDANKKDGKGQGNDGLIIVRALNDDPVKNQERRLTEIFPFRKYETIARTLESTKTVVGDHLNAKKLRGKRSPVEVTAKIKDIYPQKTVPKERSKEDKLNDNSTLVDVISAVKKIEKSIKKSKRTSAIHLSAYVNEELLVRQNVESRDRKGEIRGGAFFSYKMIFNIWKPDEWLDGHMYTYHENSGKVKVKQSGIYLIYAQITQHGGSFRKSIAVHVGDEVKPFIEHVSLERLTRFKRDFSENGTHTEEELPGYENNDNNRPKRHSVYNLANMVAVTRIEKHQQVFIKTLDKKRGVIAKPHLTYWGIARLNT